MGSEQSKPDTSQTTLVEAHSYDEFAEQVAVIARLFVFLSSSITNYSCLMVNVHPQSIQKQGPAQPQPPDVPRGAVEGAAEHGRAVAEGGRGGCDDRARPPRLLGVPSVARQPSVLRQPRSADHTVDAPVGDPLRPHPCCATRCLCPPFFFPFTHISL